MLSASDVVTTAGSPIITSASALFTSAAVGKPIVMQGAGTVGGYQEYKGTIITYTSATQVTLSNNVPNAATSITAQWGTDNSAVLNAALITLSGASNPNVPQCLTIPKGAYLFTQNINMESYASVCADPQALINIDVSSVTGGGGVGILWNTPLVDCPGCNDGGLPLSDMSQINPALAGATALTCLTTGCTSGSHPVAVGQGIWIAEGSDNTQICGNGYPCLWDNIRQYSTVTAVSGDTITLDRPLEFNFNGSTAGLWPLATITYDGIFRVTYIYDAWWRGGKIINRNSETMSVTGVNWAWGGGFDGTTFEPVMDHGFSGNRVCQAWIAGIYFTMKDTDWKHGVICGGSLGEHFTLQDSEFENIGAGAGMEIGQSTNFSTYKDNKFLNANGTNVLFYVEPMSYNTKFINNTITGTNPGIADMGGTDDLIEGNYILAPNGGGIGIGNNSNKLIPYHYSLGAQVVNNTIVTTGAVNCMSYGTFPAAVNATFTGNVCPNPLDTGIAIPGGVTVWNSVQSAVFSHNTMGSKTGFQPVRIPFGSGNSVVSSVYYPSISIGDYFKGDIYFGPKDSSGTMAVGGETVTTSGTIGPALSMTASTTTGSPTVAFSSATNLHIGGWITIAGLGTGTGYQLINLVGTTGTFVQNAGVTVTSGAVSWTAPTFAPIFPLDERAYRTVASGSSYADPVNDFYISLGGGSTGATANLDPPSYFVGTHMTGKQYIFRNLATVASTVHPYSGTTINGQTTVSLPNQYDFLRIQWNGTNFDVIGGSPAALASAGVVVSTSVLSDWTNTGIANGYVPTWNSVAGKWTPGAQSGGVADPGSNGIVKRTALNTTAAASYADFIALFSSCTSGWLHYDGTCSTPSGAGNVTGPASSTSGNFASYNGTSGTLLQDSGISSTSPVFSGSVTGAGFFPQTISAGPYVSYFEDFLNTTTQTVGATSIGSATGQSCAGSNSLSTAAHPGVMLVTSGTGGTGTGEACAIPAAWHDWPPILNLTTRFKWEAAIDVPVLPGTTVGAYQAGIVRSGASNNWGTAGAGFYLSSANGVVNDWYCLAGTTAGTVDSTVAATTAWVRLSMKGDGTNLHYYINGTEVCGTGIPLSQYTNMNTNTDIVVTATALSSTSVALDVDYVLMEYQAVR